MKIPSVLAFERKIDPSDGLMFAISSENIYEEEPIIIREKSIRGTISNRMKTKDANDPAKLNASIEKANLQTVDIAMLPADKDTLVLHFSLRILGNIGIPSACNNKEYKEKLIELVNNYKNKVGFKEIAFRYAYNIAAGRFLWRNRLAAKNISIEVRKRDTNTYLNFIASEYPIYEFKENKKLDALTECITYALEKKDGCEFLEITAKAQMENGLEVFPSQELILDDKSKKSKTLYSINTIAAMHSQKIGNALRTIDTWYPDYVDMPISIEPYGSVTSLGQAFRQSKQKMDFYSLFDDWMINDKIPPLEQQHYIMAMLIRGGVFGSSEKA